MTSAVKNAVWTADLTFSGFFAPIFCAMTTFAPKLNPMNKLTSNPTSDVLFPTAAIAFFPINCPKTTTSAKFKSCWKTPVKARGTANKIILSHKLPFNISISLCRNIFKKTSKNFVFDKILSKSEKIFKFTKNRSKKFCRNFVFLWFWRIFVKIEKIKNLTK